MLQWSYSLPSKRFRSSYCAKVGAEAKKKSFNCSCPSFLDEPREETLTTQANGLIPIGLVIDHLNDDKLDNRFYNLQLLTQQENCLKGAKNNVRRSPPRELVAINLTTDELHYFPSMSRAGKELGICSSSIKSVCEKIQRSARFKFDDYWYRFEYLNYKRKIFT